MSKPRDRPAATRRVGIMDVAERAGVSRQTVTRAMNDMPGINSATKQRVLLAARELRYRPSRFGRGLVKQDGRTLGLVVVDLTNPYFAELASNIIAVADEAGWSVLVQEIARGRQRENRVVRSLASQVDALVGYLILPDDALDELVGDIPVVRLTDRDLPGRRPWVHVDHEPGMAAALDHLIGSGRRNIVMIDFPNELGPSPRAHFYSEIYRARGFTPTVLSIDTGAEPDVEAAEHITARAIAADPTIDAIIGFNDIVAIGAMKQLRDDGVAVPTRCAVVGIDGLPVGDLVSPTLTTLKMDLVEVARILFDTALAAAQGAIEARDGQPTATVALSLMVRDSSR